MLRDGKQPSHDVPVTIKSVVVHYAPRSFLNPEPNGTVDVLLDDDSPTSIGYMPPAQHFNVKTLEDVQQLLATFCKAPNGKTV